MSSEMLATPPLFGMPRAARDSDERYTPSWLFDALGLEFDLDPAHPPHPTAVPTKRWFTRDDDGLAQPWDGLVWLNPPFSKTTPWADRFIAHGNGVFLGPLASSAWTHRMLRAGNFAWVMRDFPFTAPRSEDKQVSMLILVVPLGEVAERAVLDASRRLPDAGTLLASPETTA